MEQNPIVSMALTKDGNDIVIGQDGYVGKLTPGSVALEIAVLSNCAAFHVDRKKNVCPKKNISFTEDKHVFSLKIPIDVDLQGTSCTQYRSNNLRLLEIVDTLLLRVWEVALVSQRGDFFVTCEHSYEFSCYRDRHGAVSCPYFEGKPNVWPQFVDMLNETLREIADALPDESEFKDITDQNEEVFAPSTGRVLWWSPAQGFGAIKTREGVARVHWSQIITDRRLAELHKGAIVEFAGVINLAGNGTSFKFEAYCVRSR